MTRSFLAYAEDICCLCGEGDSFSGEHKVKASLLRDIFGNEPLVISGSGVKKYPQSPKSKHFHFYSKVCAKCNNERTQAADMEFARFHAKAMRELEGGRDPAKVFDRSEYAEGSTAYLNVFRYFGKLLCCHMAEVKAPRLLRVSKFSIGESQENYIWLGIDKDWVYKEWAAEFGDHAFASHGGLVVFGNKSSGDAECFYSTLTIGPIRYVFQVRLDPRDKNELRAEHKIFYEWCKNRVEMALREPMSEVDRLQLGLAIDEPIT